MRGSTGKSLLKTLENKRTSAGRGRNAKTNTKISVATNDVRKIQTQKGKQYKNLCGKKWEKYKNKKKDTNFCRMQWGERKKSI